MEATPCCFRLRGDLCAPDLGSWCDWDCVRCTGGQGTGTVCPAEASLGRRTRPLSHSNPKASTRSRGLVGLETL